MLLLLLCIVPLQVGNQQGVVGGMALGGMQFVMFGSYAVGLFYGEPGGMGSPAQSSAVVVLAGFA
jgi:hypothetical protein